MTKRCLCIVAGFLSVLAVSSFAQTFPVFGALNNSAPRFPSLGFSDSQLFSFGTAFNWAESKPDFLPALSTAAALRTGSARQKDSSKDMPTDGSSYNEQISLRRNLLENVHGEVGFLYGHSSGGKFSRDVEEGYVIGTVGDDKFNITVGAAYENWNGHFSRH